MSSINKKNKMNKNNDNKIKRCFFRKKLANVPANVPNFCKRFKYFQAITENHFLVITGKHEV
jgi:hypothetical protein